MFQHMQYAHTFRAGCRQSCVALAAWALFSGVVAAQRPVRHHIETSAVIAGHGRSATASYFPAPPGRQNRTMRSRTLAVSARTVATADHTFALNSG